MTRSLAFLAALWTMAFASCAHPAALETGNWELTAKSPTLHRFEAVEPHMGTLVKITLYSDSQDAAQAAFRAAFERIRALDNALSDYKPDSELNRLTRIAVGRAVPVSEDLWAVLQAAQEMARASDGAFDVTVGPVTRLWREARRVRRLPGASELRAAAARSGHEKLHLDGVRRTAMLDQPGMALDLGALAKGYAASEALAVLRRSGAGSALVAISGDLACGDPPPGSRGWRVAMHDAAARAGDIPAVVELANVAVSTAGADEQHLDEGERRYSHIVNPASAMGITEDITVTVIAPTGLEADALDTAISVLGVARGLALLESRPDTAALITRRTPTGIALFPSRRLAARISRPGTPR
jgi:FAD:protein FMN transferase